MSEKWYRRVKLGPNTTLSVGSKMGPAFSSSMGNRQNRVTVLNRPNFTTFRLVNKTGPFSNKTMVKQEMLSFKDFIMVEENMATYENTPENAKKVGWDKVPEHVKGDKNSKYVLHNHLKGTFHYTNVPDAVVESNEPTHYAFATYEKGSMGDKEHSSIKVPIHGQAGSKPPIEWYEREVKLSPEHKAKIKAGHSRLMTYGAEAHAHDSVSSEVESDLKKHRDSNSRIAAMYKKK